MHRDKKEQNDDPCRLLPEMAGMRSTCVGPSAARDKEEQRSDTCRFPSALEDSLLLHDVCQRQGETSQMTDDTCRLLLSLIGKKILSWPQIERPILAHAIVHNSWPWSLVRQCGGDV